MKRKLTKRFICETVGTKFRLEHTISELNKELEDLQEELDNYEDS